jgi:hypothetical protein
MNRRAIMSMTEPVAPKTKYISQTIKRLAEFEKQKNGCQLEERLNITDRQF